MHRAVHVGSDEIATFGDVMQLLARMPYRDILHFAGEVRGDVDLIATALDRHFAEREAPVENRP